MNIYEKINAVRMALLQRGITKDKKGYNYAYIDLPQIENVITEECNKVGLLTVVTFPVTDKGSFAEMTAYDTESPLSAEEMRYSRQDPTHITISVPCEYSLVEIKGSQPIQKVGGMMTYMRRYLYMQMFAISEHDAVEGIGRLSQESTSETEANADNKSETQPIDKEKNEIIGLFLRDLPDYIKDLEDYRRMPIEQMPLEYLQKVYKTKMAQKAKIEEAKAKTEKTKNEETKEQNDGNLF